MSRRRIALMLAIGAIVCATAVLLFPWTDWVVVVLLVLAVIVLVPRAGIVRTAKGAWRR